MKPRDIAGYIDHVDMTLTKEISDYAIDVALKDSRYTFTRKEGKQQYGYCTHCNTEYQTNKLKHNMVHLCPHCKSITTVKSSGMHRKNLKDQAYFVFFEKSVIDPEVIIAKGIFVKRDYSGDYHRVQTLYSLKFLYIFEHGNPIMLKMNYWSETWEARSKIFSFFGHEYLGDQSIKQLCSYDSLKKAVKRTVFQYSAYELYLGEKDSKDMVEYMALYAKYPSVEYLMKLGFKGLIDAKLSGGNTYSAINWRGSTLFKVLKINKNDLKEIKANNIQVSFLFLKLLQVSRKDRSSLSLQQIYEMSNNYNNHFSELKLVLNHTTLERAYNYLNKQAKIVKSALRYRWDILITWKDYIADCITLGWELTDENILFPKNVHEAHQNTIRQIKIKEDAGLNKKIAKRLKSLRDKYSFEYMGLFIRPAGSSIELIDEGKALSHCVGRYAENYAKGITNIFFIRKLNEPDKPYYTLELRDERIIQVRGLRNRNPDEAVDSFIKEFTAQKLTKEEVHRRIMIPA